MTKEITYTLEELEKKLTEKERIFCHEYIMDWNSARSARKAGYSEKTAREIGSQNLAKIHIKQYIAFIKDDIEGNLGISKQKVLNELRKLAFSSIAKLHNTWITLKEFQSLTDDEKDAIQEIQTSVRKIKTEDGTWTDVEYVKIKLHDKKGALQDLIKAMGYNAPDKVEHSGGITIEDPFAQIRKNADIDGADK